MSNLTQFLRDQKHADKNRAAIAAKKKQDWLEALGKLFDQIRHWLSDAQSEGSIDVIQQQVTLTEEGIGTYKAPALSLKAGGKTVKLKPKGMTIIGANGRVDMESVKGTYMLLYLSPPDVWVHGTGYKPDQFPQLTEELFSELVKKSLS